jgi:hypothetical protein
MGASMSLACTADKNWDTLNYERYLTIALAIGNDNPYSFACFSALNEAQQNLLISQTIAQGFQTPHRGSLARAGRQASQRNDHRASHRSLPIYGVGRHIR